MRHLYTSLPLEQAVDRVKASLTGSGFSTECVDHFTARSPGGSVHTLVFEKYYMRNSSRASLTVTVTDLTGRTEVRAVGSGGGQRAFLSFDWGAAGNFEDWVATALKGTLEY